MLIRIALFRRLSFLAGCAGKPESRLAAEGMQAEIQLVKVDDNGDAERLKFPGSPSFCTAGAD